MQVELINTGTELMLGRVLNTHEQWLCGRLADAGYVVSRQVAIPDRGPDIQQALREALSRADLIITTGGLGPTSDDLTRDYVAQLLGRRLREDPAILAHIRAFFEARNRQMPESTRVQAMVPEGALVLPNPHGTAPGLALEVSPNPYREDRKPSWVIMLPGPSRELRPMYEQAVVPLLRRVWPQPEPFVCRTLRSTGIGESVVEERVSPPLGHLIASGLEVGYCARPGQVDVRLAAKGSEADAIVHEAVEIVTERLADSIYAEGDDDLEAVLIRILTRRRETLAVAESCTGGLVAHRLTNVPGASAVFLAGYVTYSNKAKQRMLGVKADSLAQHGAVSEQVVLEMAQGARSNARSHYAVAVTGIAGPTGGTREKPVGTVFMAVATPDAVVPVRNFNPLDRETFKHVAAQQALDLLRKAIAQREP